MTVNIEDISENLSELLTNYTNLASVFYNLFINESPMDVTLQQYDSNNVLQTYTVPNRAKDKEIALTGTVDPEGVVEASVGVIYVDTFADITYIKISGTGTTGWKAVFNENYLPESIISTDGTLAANSDELIPSQKAVKTYADTKLAQNGDGSAVNNLNASNISSGTINESRLPLSVTLLGNTFNEADELVQLDASGKLPVLDGTNLIILSPVTAFGTISSGTITLIKDTIHSVIFSGAATIALPTGLSSGYLYNCTIFVKMSSIVTITQPTVTWAYATSPALTSTTPTYRITYETINGGTTWFGYWTQLGS